jgi:hypothetical protein
MIKIMKIKDLLLLAFFLGCGFFSSCSNSDDVLSINSGVKKTLSTDSTDNQKIIAYVNNFVKAHLVTSSTRATETASMNVFNISKKTYSAANTRSGEKEKADVYTLEFTKNGKKGFAIASMDSTINRVFAYTEDGALSDTLYNEGLHKVLLSIPEYCKSIPGKQITDSTDVPSKTHSITILNFVNTAWNQVSPYNDLYPTVGTLEHAYAGCGEIATAQAIAYYGALGKTSNATWPYAKLTESSNISSENPLAPTVASYVYNISNYMSPHYAVDGTYTNSTSPSYALNAYGITWSYNDGNLNLEKAWYTLSRKNAIIAMGEDKNGGGGHMWLYTGAISYVVDGSSYAGLLALYVNWGNGGSSDGWYYSDWEAPTGTNYNFMIDNEQYYITQLAH